MSNAPKIIKIGGNLTKFWQKHFCTVFLRHAVHTVLKFQFDRACFQEEASAEFDGKVKEEKRKKKKKEKEDIE